MNAKKILLIEDDTALVRGLAIRLKANGYAIAVASDAISSIGVVRRENPDLIILDLGIPGGDGFVVLERLNNLPAFVGIPVIILSARDPISYAEMAFQAGAVAYVQKPADNDQLLAVIREFLGEGRENDEPPKESLPDRLS